MSSCCAWLCALILTGVEWAAGHEDPLGDLHPQVLVMDGNFAIVFNTSMRDDRQDFTDTKKVFGMVYSPEGKLIAPRHPLEKKRSWMAGAPAGLFGKRMKLGKSTVIFGASRSPRPGYFLEAPDGRLTKVSLPWPEDVALMLCEDVFVTADGLAITGKEDPDVLRFYWFAHESAEAPVRLEIGPTFCIYDFPVASNIAYAGGRFWVAFMRGGGGDGGEVVMWSWKPGEEKGREQVLDAPAHWNSDLSLAAIGDRLCLAYHCVQEGGYDADARIETVFLKAK